jgi:hypothetical protein
MYEIIFEILEKSVVKTAASERSSGVHVTQCTLVEL